MVAAKSEEGKSMSDYEVFELSNVVLQCGITLPQVKLTYKTYGTRDNAVVMPTFYGGRHVENKTMIVAGRARPRSVVHHSPQHVRKRPVLFSKQYAFTVRARRLSKCDSLRERRMPAPPGDRASWN